MTRPIGILHFAAIGLLLACAAAIYAPGLSGAFLLDDWPTLKGLNHLASSGLLGDAVQFARESRRVVTHFTFALQRDAWPTAPEQFKVVGVAIHLLSGLALYWLLKQLCALAPSVQTAARYLPLTATTVWLLHPLHVSTVLYVAQRSTALAALFTLAGLGAYLTGRLSCLQGDHRQGYAWMSVGVGLGLLLATFSKENGILLPLFVLVIEGTLLVNITRPPKWNAWASIFLLSPLLALAGYLAYNHQQIIGAYILRDFTLAERLLTETRIIADYLGKALIPKPQGFGLFFDDFGKSTDFFTPVTTLWSTLLVASLLGAGLALRRRIPVLSFAILWFFVGHLLESTYIPLELYFEHRNYVPSVGLFFGLVWGASRLLDYVQTKPLRRFAMAGLASSLVLLALLTFHEARLWGDSLLQAEEWAKRRPDSRRVQANLAGQYASLGFYDYAARTYARMSEKYPRDPTPYLLHAELRCDAPGLPELPLDANIRFRHGERNLGTVAALERLTIYKELNRCSAYKTEFFLMLARTLAENPVYRPDPVNLQLILARLYTVDSQFDAAIDTYELVKKRRKTAELPLTQAELAFKLGDIKAAAAFLKEAESRANAKNFERIEVLRSHLRLKSGG